MSNFSSLITNSFFLSQQDGVHYGYTEVLTVGKRKEQRGGEERTGKGRRGEEKQKAHPFKCFS
jgi:hypothetical protein